MEISPVANMSGPVENAVVRYGASPAHLAAGSGAISGNIVSCSDNRAGGQAKAKEDEALNIRPLAAFPFTSKGYRLDQLLRAVEVAATATCAGIGLAKRRVLIC